MSVSTNTNVPPTFRSPPVLRMSLLLKCLMHQIHMTELQLEHPPSSTAVAHPTSPRQPKVLRLETTSNTSASPQTQQQRNLSPHQNYPQYPLSQYNQSNCPRCPGITSYFSSPITPDVSCVNYGWLVSISCVRSCGNMFKLASLAGFSQVRTSVSLRPLVHMKTGSGGGGGSVEGQDAGVVACGM